MRRLLRWLGWGLGGLAGLALLLLGALTVLVWFTLPDHRAEVRIAGLSGPVSILRDADGIPRIRAATERDAFMALGYVHAQDRLFQMEAMRRLGAGRMAELVGPPAARVDRTMRTLGLAHRARAQLARLSPDTRAALDAYAAGANAYIAAHGWMAAPEFVLLAAAPEPWRPEHSLLWGKLMGMVLSGNYRSELLRLSLAERLAPERLAELWPRLDPAEIVAAADPRTIRAYDVGDATPDGAAPATRHAAAGPAAPQPVTPALAAHAGRLLASHFGPDDYVQPTTASNVFAVNGARSATGRPLLASDPHLLLGQPILWYLVRIELPGRVLVGATVPGVPFLVLGHNGRVAWGFTTTHSDTQDLFIERPAQGAPGQYETPDGPRPFATRTEEIAVRFGAAQRFTVRETRHGPVISDLDGGAGGPGGAADAPILALAATALAGDDTTPDAFLALNRARTVEEALAALDGMSAPQQNVVVADTAGRMAMTVVGRVPIRRAGDGTVPVPGWNGSHDWVGVAPAAALPRFVDPPGGVLVHANNQFLPDETPLFLGRHWPPSFRARRIAAMINGAGAHSAEVLVAMQVDTLALDARDALPHALRLARRPPAPGTPEAAANAQAQANRILAVLGAWDARMAAERAEPLIFSAWMRAFARAVLEPHLGADHGALGDNQMEFLIWVMARGQHWCGPGADACAPVLRRTLHQALDGLARTHGGNELDWKWGEAHRARFDHTVFRFVPPLRALFGSQVPVGGGAHTVLRAAGFGGRDGFAAVHGAGYRAVYDLADLDASRFVIGTGQSGHVMSGQFRSFLERWRRGETIAIGADPGLNPVAMRLVP
ncbi:MAG: penicillin acylase family protein [Alphaproteobacteria bacterium]|nr:penicillin acylase family protein [Alphaproteobacteria bacterium]